MLRRASATARLSATCCQSCFGFTGYPSHGYGEHMPSDHGLPVVSEGLRVDGVRLDRLALVLSA
jgi:hypothetical protein